MYSVSDTLLYNLLVWRVCAIVQASKQTATLPASTSKLTPIVVPMASSSELLVGRVIGAQLG